MAAHKHKPYNYTLRLEIGTSLHIHHDQRSVIINKIKVAKWGTIIYLYLPSSCYVCSAIVTEIDSGETP